MFWQGIEMISLTKNDWIFILWDIMLAIPVFSPIVDLGKQFWTYAYFPAYR